MLPARSVISGRDERVGTLGTGGLFFVLTTKGGEVQGTPLDSKVGTRLGWSEPNILLPSVARGNGLQRPLRRQEKKKGKQYKLLGRKREYICNNYIQHAMTLRMSDNGLDLPQLSSNLVILYKTFN